MWPVIKRVPSFVALCVLLAIVSLAVALPPGTAAAPGPSAGDVIPGRYIVVLKDGASRADIVRNYGLAVSQVYTDVLNGFAGPISAERARALAADPLVKSVEPDRVFGIAGQTVPSGVERIEASVNDIAHIDGEDAEIDVDVAIIDTGVDADHPDLRVAGGVGYVWRFLDPWVATCGQAASWDDDHGHGTHVAGTVAALDNDLGVVGVAPGARIWAVKVAGDGGYGCVSDFIRGVDWVTCTRTKAEGCPQSALDANPIEVANASLGWRGNSPAVRQAIQNSVAEGVFYAVAAGNSTRDVYGKDGVFDTDDDILPAAYPEVATVSAMVDTDGKAGGLGAGTDYGEDDSFASFSNFSGSFVAENPVTSPGLAIDLIMPGVDILSTWKNGTYATMSGTSMASPHAAGVAALYIAANGPAFDADGVFAIRQALIDEGIDQASGDRLVHPETEPDANPEKLGHGAGVAAVETVSGDTGAGCTALPVPWPVPEGDGDCDGWTDAEEEILGTDPGLACGPGGWPPDLNDDTYVDITDLSLMGPPVWFSETGDAGYSQRRDVSPDGAIDITDLSRMGPPIYFSTCAP